jgi:Tol biopolymer transport system component
MRLLLRCVFVVQGICIVLIAGTLSSDTGPYWLAYTVYDGYPSLVYRANPDGSNFQHIADGDAYAWSPDGRWIIFRAFEQAENNLFRIRWDGRLKQQLTYSEEYERGARYSSDGQWILFITNQNRVYRMRSDGSEQQLIIQDDTPSLPYWSSDGQWVVFDQYLSEEHERRVYLMRPDGSDRQIIAAGYNPTWSPDGRWIAFDCDETTAIICRISAEDALRGEGQPELWLKDAQDLVWSPDGQWVAFVRSVPVEVVWLGQEDHELAIFYMHVDSSIPEAVMLPVVGHAFNPTWSPDGQWIALMHNWEMHTTLFRIRPDGSDSHALTTQFMIQPMSPLWSPRVKTEGDVRYVIVVGLGFVAIGCMPWSRIGAYFRRQPRQSRVH